METPGDDQLNEALHSGPCPKFHGSVNIEKNHQLRLAAVLSNYKGIMSSNLLHICIWLTSTESSDEEI